MHAVVGQAGSCLGVKVHKQQAPVLGNLPGRLDVKSKTGIMPGKVGNQGTRRSLKTRGCHQHDQPGMDADLVDQLLVGFHEPVEVIRPGHRLELAELGNHDGCFDAF